MYDEETRLNEAGKGKRPFLVWVIFLYSFFGAILGSIGVVFIPLFAKNMPLAQAAYYSSLGPFDYASSALLLILAMIASIYLIKMKRLAVQFYGIAVVINILDYLYSIVFKNWLMSNTVQGIVGAMAGLLLQICIFAYVWNLARKKIIA